MATGHKIKNGYAWKITQLFGVLKDDHKVSHFYTTSAIEREEVRANGIDWTDAEKFRVYDDDGVLNAHGMLVDGGDFADLFEPMDDYCIGMWGATEIKYYNKTLDTYETL